MNIEKSIEALNTLIEINNDRIQGYKTASGDTQEADLKSLFERLSATSERNVLALNAEINFMGGVPVQDSNTTGKIHRMWMDFKAMLTGKDRASVLNSCIFGDETAISTYDDALISHAEYFSPQQQAIVTTQRAAIQADLLRVKTLHEVAIA